MPSNLLAFLPLLAGYLFLHSSYRFRFRAKTLEGHRLVFETAIAGFGLFGLARGLVLLFRSMPFGERLIDAWTLIAGDSPFFGTAAVCLLMAPLAGVGLNLASAAWQVREVLAADWPGAAAEGSEGAVGGAKGSDGREVGRLGLREAFRLGLVRARSEALAAALEGTKSELKAFLFRAAERAQEDEMMVLLTMKDRKVYVGWVVDSPTPDRNELDLAILPAFSGYRRADNLKVELNTTYPVDEYGNTLDEEDFIVVLGLADIASARYFDDLVFKSLFPPAG
ncbi:MAG: hypothetical protein IPJ17_08690 [Holophagales bacterium]|nr:MAG: hypothetical protein IPJ17_08690 [Holophagales bacterium]